MMDAVHLSNLLGHDITSPQGDRVARLDDVIVSLGGDDYPLVSGIVGRVGKLRVFLPVSRVADLSPERIVLSTPKADLRPFERRDGEVLLREDILGHRLIDVEDGKLVRSRDLEIEPAQGGWSLCAVDTRPPRRWLWRRAPAGEQYRRDWKDFEPLIGHRPSKVARGPLRRLRRLKPAQLADLLEEASHDEGEEILEEVHGDPELEADVFEELDPDTANRLFGDRTDAEVAEVLDRMRADDAADAIADLPQERRMSVLDLLPAAKRAKLLVLLGFNPTTAGGLMGVEWIAVNETASVADALGHVHAARDLQTGTLSSLYVLDDEEHLTGAVQLVDLLRAPPEQVLSDLVDRQAVCVAPDSDLSDVAILMADYNLVAIPVVDDDDKVIGLITVDDVLEVIIPEDWKRRQPAPHPEHPHPESADAVPAPQ